MTSMTILGARTTTIPAFDYAALGLPGLASEARTALIWRVAVQGFGRDSQYPHLRARVRVLEFEHSGNRQELEAKVTRASAEDLHMYCVGD